MSSTRTAVISGAGTGIGAAAARSLAQTCTDLVLLGRRVDRIQAVADEISAIHPDVRVFPRSVDVTDVAAVEGLRDWTAANLPQVDIIVNNAGSVQPSFDGSLQNVVDVWDSTLRANLVSVVLLTEALLPQLPTPGGRIVIVGSNAAQFGNGSIAYAAAKGALQTYAITMSKLHGPKGINTNVVAPGYTGDTELVVGRISEERHATLLTGIAVGRPATSPEIAAVIDFLASPGASFVNGQTLIANGGIIFPG